MDGRSMARLLEFLQHSFSGGTDVDKPFELALQRLQKAEWSQVRDGLHPRVFCLHQAFVCGCQGDI